jgi:molybdenum cofactor cytidylyltransferase
MNRPIGAIVLAAGTSSRMGTNKALLPIDGQPMIAHVVGRVSASGAVSKIVVVTGHEPQQVQAAVGDDAIQYVQNDQYEQGMLSSIQAGIAAIQADIAAIFVVLGDQPGVRETTIQALVRAWRERAQPAIVQPSYQGKHGHPILIDASYADEILALTASETLKTFVDRNRSNTVVVDVDDPAVVNDVDTPADYQRVLRDLR